MQSKADFLKEDEICRQAKIAEALRVAEAQAVYEAKLNLVPSATVYRFMRLILATFKAYPTRHYALLDLIRSGGNRFLPEVSTQPDVLNHLYFEHPLSEEFTPPERRILHMALAEFKRDAEEAGWKVRANYPNLTLEFLP